MNSTAKERKVASITEFVSLVGSISDELTENEELYFRGQADCAYELTPSLGRERYLGWKYDNSLLDEERNMITMAKYKMPETFHDNLPPIELLSLLQHHGVPTRLLDITSNAFVALYFACYSEADKSEKGQDKWGNKGKDGEVIVFKRDEADIGNYPIINALADSYRFVHNFSPTLKMFYEDVKNQPYFLEQKHLPSDEVEAEWVKNCCQELIFAYTPIRSLRQQIQQGSYLLFPNKVAKYGEKKQYYFQSEIEPIKKTSDNVSLRIIIPKEEKEEMLLNLKLYGISKQTLFADNTDIVCGEIAKDFRNKIKERKF